MKRSILPGMIMKDRRVGRRGLASVVEGEIESSSDVVIFISG
jgi:hypothetical protein